MYFFSSMVGHPALCDDDAVPWHGQCVRHANQHVGGYCGDGEPYCDQ